MPKSGACQILYLTVIISYYPLISSTDGGTTGIAIADIPIAELDGCVRLIVSLVFNKPSNSYTPRSHLRVKFNLGFGFGLFSAVVLSP